MRRDRGHMLGSRPHVSWGDYGGRASWELERLVTFLMTLGGQLEEVLGRDEWQCAYDQ